MKNWKKHPKKLLRIGPDPFFPQSSLGISPQPKIDLPYYEISGLDICSLICGSNHLPQVQSVKKVYYAENTISFQLIRVVKLEKYFNSPN